MLFRRYPESERGRGRAKRYLATLARAGRIDSCEYIDRGGFAELEKVPGYYLVLCHGIRVVI